MGYKGYSKAQGDATARYESKTYKFFNLKLRYDEDSELISELESLKDLGISKREWLAKLFYTKPQIPDDLVSLQSVEEILRAFRVDNVDSIMDELRGK